MTKLAKKRRPTILPTNIAILINDIIAIILFSIVILLAIALSSYNVNDNIWFNSSSIPDNIVIYNRLGIFGAFVSNLLFYTIGYAAWWILIGIFCIGYLRIIYNQFKVNNLLAVIKFTLFIIVLLSITILDATCYKWFVHDVNNSIESLNGYIHANRNVAGFFIVNYLSVFVGNFGVFFIALIAMIIGFYFIFNLSFRSTYHNIKFFIHRILYQYILINTIIIIQKAIIYIFVFLRFCHFLLLRLLKKRQGAFAAKNHNKQHIANVNKPIQNHQPSDIHDPLVEGCNHNNNTIQSSHNTLNNTANNAPNNMLNNKDLQAKMDAILNNHDQAYDPLMDDIIYDNHHNHHNHNKGNHNKYTEANTYKASDNTLGNLQSTQDDSFNNNNNNTGSTKCNITSSEEVHIPQDNHLNQNAQIDYLKHIQSNHIDNQCSKDSVCDINEDVINIQNANYGDSQKNNHSNHKRDQHNYSDNSIVEDKTELDNRALLLSTELLSSPQVQSDKMNSQTINFISNNIESKLLEFNVEAKIINTESGPVVTRYEILPAKGVKGDRIVALSKEIARGLALPNIRILETMQGKNSMAIEVPNYKRQTIYLRDVLESSIYQDSKSKVTLALGRDVTGGVVVADLAKMPHLLVAGTTGSGKSVAVNVMILSILYKSSPDEVKFIMIDPKMVELSFYQNIPHLLAPVIIDMNHATNALRWAVVEMERRYKTMADSSTKNILSYNQKMAKLHESTWPYIVIIIDELADLMMVAGKKIEQYIARIAQKARAVGIHLIVATQRPSVDVITGLIKANIPTRIAFQVSSKIDSRTILDCMGAEALLGQGDMLFSASGASCPQRVHGAFINDDELQMVVDNLKKNHNPPEYIEEIITGEQLDSDILNHIDSTIQSNNNRKNPGIDYSVDHAQKDEVEKDAVYDFAVKFIFDTKRCSISSLQTKFGIGYNRAARIMHHLEQIGMVKRNSRGGFDLIQN